MAMTAHRRHKRPLDIALALAAIPFAIPAVSVLAFAVSSTSNGGAFFGHERMGRNGIRFRVWKLRSMVQNAERAGPSVTAARDPRITKVGAFIRKTKLDELPQLFNVLSGEMSIVGPRPEAPVYVDVDDARWQKVLSVRPGITDLASIAFRDEESLLALAIDRDRAYREVILPMKLDLAMSGIDQSSLWFDLALIGKTAWAIVQKRTDVDGARFEIAERRIAELNHEVERDAESKECAA